MTFARSLTIPVLFAAVLSGCGGATASEPDAGVTDAGQLPTTGSTCGSTVEVNGTVDGASIAAGATAALVKSAFEYFYLGENLVTVGCCVDLPAAPAILSLGFATVRAGTHQVASFQQVDMTSTGVFASVDTAQGRTEATAGTVTLTKSGNRWTGTFDLTFPSAQTLTGTFEASATALMPCP